MRLCAAECPHHCIAGEFGRCRPGRGGSAFRSGYGSVMLVIVNGSCGEPPPKSLSSWAFSTRSFPPPSLSSPPCVAVPVVRVNHDRGRRVQERRARRHRVDGAGRDVGRKVDLHDLRVGVTNDVERRAVDRHAVGVRQVEPADVDLRHRLRRDVDAEQLARAQLVDDEVATVLRRDDPVRVDVRPRRRTASR